MGEETALLGESLVLMIVGMGIVFAFLLLLVALMHGMSWLAERLAPLQPEPASDGALAGVADDARAEGLIAVIAAAVARYRADHTRR